MTGQAAVRFVFEGNVLDLARRELRRGEGLVSIQPQVFDLLVSTIDGPFEALLEHVREADHHANRSLGEHRQISAPYRVLAACYAHLGQMGQAREAARQVLELDPGYSIVSSMSTGYAAFQNPKAGVYIDGMRKAGIPD
jgi:tetratricopeptide (TPR) repeat protein